MRKIAGEPPQRRSIFIHMTNDSSMPHKYFNITSITVRFLLTGFSTAQFLKWPNTAGQYCNAFPFLAEILRFERMKNELKPDREKKCKQDAGFFLRQIYAAEDRFRPNENGSRHWTLGVFTLVRQTYWTKLFTTPQINAHIAHHNAIRRKNV